MYVTEYFFSSPSQQLDRSNRRQIVEPGTKHSLWQTRHNAVTLKVGLYIGRQHVHRIRD